MQIASFSTLTTAEFRIIDIHDSNHEIEYTPTLQLPGHTILGRDPGHIYINCMDDLVCVLVSMRVWDSVPNEETDQGWSEPEVAEFSCRSGTVYVNQWTRGIADIWHLPVSGDFQISVRHKGRDTIEQKAKEVRRRYSGLGQHPRERVSRLHELDGTEKYLIDAWPLLQ